MSNKNLFIIDVISSDKIQFIDITEKVTSLVTSSNAGEGVCHVFTPHTTAALTINENADPDVKTDMIKGLEDVVSEKLGYKHAEGNSPAHIKASIIGASSHIIVEEGKLLLGTWQGIYFCEFDGPRKRKVYVKIIAS
ncbi:MAG: secondary thiamine-phosphate synthase enzyme YjbQ [Candidatus Aadella gelida]|nr:secondary thiamine-phosphate synthase enzyme YjbQ [Candidatus Aadella gelida]